MASKRTGKQQKKIEPPPENASYEELDDYFSKHSLEDLEKAGIAKELSSEEQEWLDQVASSVRKKVDARTSRAQLNLAFPEPDLFRFVQYAERKHIPPSTLARAWILERLDQELGGNK